MKIVHSFAFAALLTVAPALASVACSDGSAATTGKLVTLKTKVSAPTDVRAGFTNGAGWSIKLTRATLATGPLYYFEGAVIFSQAAPRPLPRLFAIREAFAHPGHYVSGESRGEMLSSAVVDLLANDTLLASGEGVTGVVRSATFHFGVGGGELGTHVAVFEGTATKGAEVRIFRAEIDAVDVATTKGLPAVEGCPFAEATVDGDGTVTLSPRPAVWFDAVEFDAVPSSTDGRPVLLAPGPARNALTRGMKAGQGYVFQYARP